LTPYQTEVDDTLQTKDKTIPGAINEVNKLLLQNEGNILIGKLEQQIGTVGVFYPIIPDTWNFAEEPVEPKFGVVYYDVQQNKYYRWMGRTFIENAFLPSEPVNVSIANFPDNVASDNNVLEEDAKAKWQKFIGANISKDEIAQIAKDSVDLTPYQTKTDNGLATLNKTIVGGINENRGRIVATEGNIESHREQITTLRRDVDNIELGVTTFTLVTKFDNSAPSPINQVYKIKYSEGMTMIYWGDGTGTACSDACRYSRKGIEKCNNSESNDRHPETV
jgi:hypothetical protein